MHLRRSLAFISVLALLATLLVVPGVQAAANKGHYIVVLDDAVSRPAVVARGHGKAYGAQVKHVYSNSLKGYSAKLNKNKLAKLRSDPKVAFVVRDGVAHIAKKGGNRPPKDPPGGGDGGGGGGTCGEVGSWGQDRIDQRTGTNGCYDPNSHGAGVTAYILDTGVDPDHPQYKSRWRGWKDVVSGGPEQDCHGHGTHVAGTIGGTRHGVAQDVGIVGVRVLDCGGSGSWSDIIEGLDWVVQQSGDKKVANLSLSGPPNAAMDQAIAMATSKGVIVVVAAGNSYGNACNYSPARAPSAITVGATTSSDRKASYSNSGTCLDLFAPGDRIISTLPGNDTGTKSGTSMAAPHVAGVAAILLGQGTLPDDVSNRIRQTATSGRIKSEGRGSPDLLLYVE